MSETAAEPTAAPAYEPEPGQTVVELSGGHRAVIRDPETLTYADRKRILSQLEGIPGEIARGLAIGEHTIATMLHSWTLPLPHPLQDPSALDTLSLRDADKITEACATAAAPLFPNREASKDPASPSKPSAG